MEKLARSGSSHDKVDVIVTFDRHVPMNAKDEFQAHGASVNREFEKLPMVAISVPRRALEGIANSNGVRFVSADSTVTATSDSARRAANTPPIGSYHDAVYNGGGYAVAVIDSGVAAHPDLNVVLQKDFVGEGSRDYPYDAYGHGTHVAGIIAGEGAASGYVHWGQAWNAPIVSLRVLGDNGSGSTSDLLSALDWLLVNGSRYSVRVVNMSLGKAIEESAASDPLVQAARRS